MCQRLRTAFSVRWPPSCLTLVAHLHAPYRSTSLRSFASSALVQPDAALPVAPDCEALAPTALRSLLRTLWVVLLVVPSAFGFFSTASFGGRPGFLGGGSRSPLAFSLARNWSSVRAILSELPAYLTHIQAGCVGAYRKPQREEFPVDRTCPSPTGTASAARHLTSSQWFSGRRALLF